MIANQTYVAYSAVDLNILKIWQKQIQHWIKSVTSTYIFLPS